MIHIALIILLFIICLILAIYAGKVEDERNRALRKAEQAREAEKTAQETLTKVTTDRFVRPLEEMLSKVRQWDAYAEHMKISTPTPSFRFATRDLDSMFDLCAIDEPVFDTGTIAKEAELEQYAISFFSCITDLYAVPEVARAVVFPVAVRLVEESLDKAIARYHIENIGSTIEIKFWHGDAK